MLENWQENAQKIWKINPFKMVLSAPRPGGEFCRATLTRQGTGWQLEKRTETQVFHENLAGEAVAGALHTLLETAFTQLNAFGESGGYSLRVSKKGKVLGSRTKAAAVKPPEGHNRQKAAFLPEGSVIPPLVDMGVFTADGRVAAGMYDKYRQINRFVELVHHALPEKLPESLRVVDFGCGKSYLTFILYYYLRVIRGVKPVVTGLDLKADVVEHCNAAARRYGYGGLSFEVGDIARWPGHGVDMVVTLHACDTATDLALAHAVGWGAKWIFSVPCCQHELNGQMQSEALAILTRYGLVQERVAALMTDAIRANLLIGAGYKTQLAEFVELEHTPKNILIRAVKSSLPAATRKKALAEVRALCKEFHLDPALLRALERQGIL